MTSGTRNPGDETESGSPQSGEGICPVCSGSGEADGRACPSCGGTGRITVIVGDA
jgi:DnaJ-class molecular chaperone